MVAPVDECAAGQTAAVQRHAAIPVASAVVATLEVAIPDNASQADDVGSFYVAEGVKRLAGARASKEQDLEAVTKAMVAPADEFTTGQAEVVQDGGEDGGSDRGNNGGESIATASMASAAAALIETPEIAVPADVGHAVSVDLTREVAVLVDVSHAASVDTACAAEDAERLAGTSASEQKVAGAVATAMVAPIDEFAVGQAVAIQDGGENNGNNSGDAAGAAPTVRPERGQHW